MSNKGTSHERRITIPSDIWESLGYYAEDEKMRLSEGMRDLVTRQAVVIEVLKNHLHKMGHYPPKGTLSLKTEPLTCLTSTPNPEEQCPPD